MHRLCLVLCMMANISHCRDFAFQFFLPSIVPFHSFARLMPLYINDIVNTIDFHVEYVCVISMVFHIVGTNEK